MKKLLYLIGPNFCVKNFADPLLEKFNDWNVVCISDYPHIESEIYTHIPINIKRKPDLFFDAITFFRIFFFIKKFRPDKIVYSTPKISFIVALVNKFFQYDSIYIHRGAVYQNFTGIKFCFYKKIDRFILKNSNKTIFISRSLFNYVSSLNPDLSLEYNRRYSSGQGVDLKKFTPKIRTEKKELTFGYLGRFDPEKGMSLLFQIIHKYSHDANVKFILKGFEDGYALPKNWKLIYPNLKIIGWDDKVNDFFHSIDVNLFPSKREGFGNICIEAAAANIPTIGYKIPGVSDAISNEVTGWLVNSDSEFIEMVDELVTKPHLIAPIVKTARGYAEVYFDRNKILDEMTKLIKI